MRVSVDLDRCQGNGTCAETAPEVFGTRADGSVDVLQDAPPPGLHRAVLRAARRCPTQAISVQA